MYYVLLFVAVIVSLSIVAVVSDRQAHELLKSSRS